MSRLALATWLGALCAALFPTWQIWRDHFGEPESFSCGGLFFRGTSVWREQFDLIAMPLRADANAVLYYAFAVGAPAIVVLVCLGRWHSALAGRRAAAVLGLTALLNPILYPYFDLRECRPVPLLSGQWFGEVLGGWSSTSASLLVAAGLVLVATRWLGPAEEPLARPATFPWPRIARWTLLLVIDYLAVLTVLRIVFTLLDRSPDALEYGLICWFYLDYLIAEPGRALLLPVVVLYAVARCLLWRRRSGRGASVDHVVRAHHETRLR
ncbi:hypothetical protein GCM10009733_001710 [Nonomuraea maheshkhaliensis]|uniref:Uncharacterized protein n=1 Tax=Nonomuraea maheshkhaliensis TaxID=419590 RepID=A0ABP4QK28_9ACTN